MNVVPATEVREREDLRSVLASADQIEEMVTTLKQGYVWIVRRAVDSELLTQLREYLRGVAAGSLPNYQALVAGAPNFHRVYGDPRSYVQGRFHQFSFFPWNQDVFSLFERLRDVYRLNNRINGWPDDKYLGIEPEDGCTARLTVQAYPRGVGYIKKHTDAVGRHKFTTMSCCMSKKGEDFQTGGLYVGGADGDLDLDAELQMGDVVWIHSHVPHEVQPIDPSVRADWIALQGKWTLICAVNKLAGQHAIEDSAQL